MKLLAFPAARLVPRWPLLVLAAALRAAEPAAPPLDPNFTPNPFKPAVVPTEAPKPEQTKPTNAGDEVKKKQAEFLDLFRAYEPTQVGFTWDDGDERAMDYTFSAMFPLLHGYYPDRSTDIDWPWLRDIGVHPYLAATIRGSFYVPTTRPSSPVVSKRFNPLLTFRHWFQNDSRTAEARSRFVELLYAHESNGQDIASEQRFNDQVRVYLGSNAAQPTQDQINTARHYARDLISRGWDYVALRGSWDFDVPIGRVTAFGRYDYYLNFGEGQRGAENYNDWEEPGLHDIRRDRYDGLAFGARLQTKGWRWEKFPYFELDGRVGLTWTTGTLGPTQHNTWKAEFGFRLANLPFVGWYRTGYNSDLVDYYHRDTSVGFAVSFWSF